MNSNRPTADENDLIDPDTFDQDSFESEDVMDVEETYYVHFAHKDGSGTVLRSRVFWELDEALARRDHFRAQGREARVEVIRVATVERRSRFTAH